MDSNIIELQRHHNPLEEHAVTIRSAKINIIGLSCQSCQIGGEVELS
ncbi:MAG: hypothetical protein ACLSHP_00850 [Coprococcus sp.]